MAKLVGVSIKDSAVDAFMNPFFVVHQGQAVRSFIDEVNKAGSQLNSHPEDYSLYIIGEFDDQTGCFGPSAPELLLRAKDCLKPIN